MLQSWKILFNLNLLETNTRLKKKTQNKQTHTNPATTKQTKKEKTSSIWNKASEMQPTAIYFNRLLSSSVVIVRHSELRIKDLEGWEALAWLEPLHVALSKPQTCMYKQLGKQRNADGSRMSWYNLLQKICLLKSNFPPSNLSLLLREIFLWTKANK